jgi:hypothetical protein
VDPLQHVGGRDVGEVERRILAQQDHVELGECDPPRFSERDVIAHNIAHFDRLDGGKYLRSALGQLRRAVIAQPVTALLRFEQQSEGRIAADVDPVDRVHLNGDIQNHTTSHYRL